LAITEYGKFHLPVATSSDGRCERVVSPIQFKLNFRIGRHSDVSSIQLRLTPTRRQTQRIKIGKKNVGRLDLFQLELQLRGLLTFESVLPDRTHFGDVINIWIETSKRKCLRRGRT